MFEHVAVTSVLAAWGISVIPAVLAQSFVIAGPFHKYQRETPQTWRPENPRKYGGAIGVNVFGALMFAVLYAFVAEKAGGKLAGGWVVNGLAFGGLVWAAARVPRILAIALFANVHRGFVVGMLLADLLGSVICGLVCAKVIGG